MEFLSTPSARRATSRLPSTSKPRIFLSTPSARRATELHSFRQGQSEISIHALREEGDRGHPGRRAGEGISIHALREEGDAKTTLDRGHRHKFLSTPSARRATAARIAAYKGWVFLSTPSARRATWSLWMRWNHPQNFYPRPPRGGRPARREPLKGAANISIHALREEGDLLNLCSHAST